MLRSMAMRLANTRARQCALLRDLLQVAKAYTVNEMHALAASLRYLQLTSQSSKR